MRAVKDSLPAPSGEAKEQEAIVRCAQSRSALATSFNRGKEGWKALDGCEALVERQVLQPNNSSARFFENFSLTCPHC
jgi:hypothetical protein